MRHRAWLSIAATALAASALACARASAAEEETILARAWVPNALLRQGEVRLVRHGDEVVVQSVLHTAYARRAREHIAGKERLHWPGSADAASYMKSLDEAIAAYEAARASSKESRGLAIEFRTGPGGARVDFRLPVVSHGRDGLRVEPSTAWRTLDLSPVYVEKNQELILEDTFGKRGDKALAALRGLRAPPAGGARRGGG
jgi:hypothetical protein